MTFFSALVSKDETNVDAVTVGGIVALLIMIVCTLWCVWLDPHTFSPLTFGSGTATILGGYGVGKGGRDALTPQPPEKPDEPRDH